jgi:hypothetical protein
MIKLPHAAKCLGLVVASMLCAATANAATILLPSFTVSFDEAMWEGDAPVAVESPTIPDEPVYINGRTDVYDDNSLDPAFATGFVTIQAPDSVAQLWYDVVLSENLVFSDGDHVISRGTLSVPRPGEPVTVAFGGFMPSKLEPTEYTIGLVFTAVKPAEFKPAEFKPAEFRVDFHPETVVSSLSEGASFESISHDAVDFDFSQ